MPMASLGDRRLRRRVGRVWRRTLHCRSASALKRLRGFFRTRGDPNDWRQVEDNAVRAASTAADHPRPYAHRHPRAGAERGGEISRPAPVELDALATRVLLDESNGPSASSTSRASGSTGRTPIPANAAGERRQARASREVILAGGAFNTPQLLMLSGIGPREDLSATASRTRVDLPASVGTCRTATRSRRQSDGLTIGRCWRERDSPRAIRSTPVAGRADGRLRDQRRGLAVITRSKQRIASRSVLLRRCSASFSGYFPGYSQANRRAAELFELGVLKAHTATARAR